MAWRRRLCMSGAAAVWWLASGSLGAQTQTQAPPIPIPRPFPQPNQPPTSPPATRVPDSTPAPAPPRASQPTTAPAAVATTPPTVSRPTDRDLGVTVYPAAEFIDSYDAGHGQRYYLFGTNAPYADIVAYFRTTLRDSGHELFKAPAMQVFDLGKYRDDTMAYPPSVVVKDYTWALDGQRSDGYLVIDGTKEKRYKTVIQIVPATGK
jgi:hypothetical protein